MSQLDVTTNGGDGESHPIAREVHRQIRGAIDRSEMSLRWIAEGEDQNAIAEVIDVEGRLVRKLRNRSSQLLTNSTILWS